MSYVQKGKMDYGAFHILPTSTKQHVKKHKLFVYEKILVEKGIILSSHFVEHHRPRKDDINVDKNKYFSLELFLALLVALKGMGKNSNHYI